MMDHQKSRKEEFKRVFFAFEVFAPWPKELPDGRVLDESSRHLTLAFLGHTHYPSLKKILHSFPTPYMKVGLTGVFDRCEFLPPKRANVASWHIAWLSNEVDLGVFQKEVADWLTRHNFPISLNPKGFLPHVTIARRPFSIPQWQKAFKKLPLYIKSIHLYESAGNLKYVPLWSFSLEAPFEPAGKVGESRFLIRGDSLQQLYTNLYCAVAFRDPEVLNLKTDDREFKEKFKLLQEPVQRDGIWTCEIRML